MNQTVENMTKTQTDLQETDDDIDDNNGGNGCTFNPVLNAVCRSHCSNQNEGKRIGWDARQVSGLVLKR